MSEEQQCDKHWRKKPVVIEAVQWDESMTTLLALRAKGLRWVSHDGHVEHPDLCRNLRIRTLEDRDDGAHHVSPGDWIIKGVAGEFYACKPDIFAATYEPAFTRSHEQVFVVDDGHVGIAAVRKLLESDTHEQPIDVIGGTPHERAAVAALSTTPQKPVDPESEAANPVWDLVIQTCAQAWPAGLLTWSQSPTELIVKIINERDEAREERDAAVTEGVRLERQLTAALETTASATACSKDNVLEEAALVCEARAKDDEYTGGEKAGLHYAAFNIRALKNSPDGGKQT